MQKQNILGEFIKEDGETMLQKITYLFRKIWQFGRVLKMGKEKIVNLINRGGGKSKENVGNYHLINIVRSTCKTSQCILKEKLIQWMEDQQICG